MALHEKGSEKEAVHMDDEHAEMAQAHKSLHGAAESGLAATDQYVSTPTRKCLSRGSLSLTWRVFVGTDDRWSRSTRRPRGGSG